MRDRIGPPLPYPETSDLRGRPCSPHRRRRRFPRRRRWPRSRWGPPRGRGPEAASRPQLPPPGLPSLDLHFHRRFVLNLFELASAVRSAFPDAGGCLRYRSPRPRIRARRCGSVRPFRNTCNFPPRFCSFWDQVFVLLVLSGVACYRCLNLLFVLCTSSATEAVVTFFFDALTRSCCDLERDNALIK